MINCKHNKTCIEYDVEYDIYENIGGTGFIEDRQHVETCVECGCKRLLFQHNRETCKCKWQDTSKEWF